MNYLIRWRTMNDEQIKDKGTSKLHCQEIEQRLDDYLEGELPAKEMLQVEAHLQRCSECCSLVNDLREIISIAATLADQPVPAGVSQRLRARLQQETGLDMGQTKPTLSIVR